MLRIEPVNEENVWKLCGLRVKPEQEDFVASNRDSLVEAYVTVAAGRTALPFGIYEGETPVGFLMIGYDRIGEGEIRGVLDEAYNLWRFMIDERYQGKGCGREALSLALGYVRTRPCGPAEYIYLSYEPENTRAAALYHSFGFRETGDTDEGELIAVRRLDSEE